MKALIITGGFIDDGFTLDYMERENYNVVFAVDSGLGFFYRTCRMPDYIVGDFDSVEEEVLKKYEGILGSQQCDDRVQGGEFRQREEQQRGGCRKHEGRQPQLIRLNPMKDDTDTEHALHMALDMGCKEIHIFGATGTRLDHVLGNLQLLGLGLRKNVDCVIIDPHNRIRLIDRETILHKDKQFGKYVSLIPYTPEVTGLTLEGFQYPLNHYTMSSFYVEGAAPVSGVSNEIVENTARITMESGILVLVESRD